MSEVSSWSSGIAASADSSFFCFAVRSLPARLAPVLTALRIDAPFPPGCLASGKDADQLRVLIHRVSLHCVSMHCVSNDQQEEVGNHSNSLPSRFAVDLAILHRNVQRIVKHQACHLEADAVFFAVDPVLPFIPGEFHGGTS